MASVTREKRGGTIRINISAKDYSRLIPENANLALVRQWIEKGREREDIRDHLDEIIATRFSAQKEEIEHLQSEIKELKDTLERSISFFAQTMHANLIATTATSHYALEEIHFDKKNGKKILHENEQTYALAQIKHKAFKQLLNRILPEFEINLNLINFLKDEEKKDA